MFTLLKTLHGTPKVLSSHFSARCTSCTPLSTAGIDIVTDRNNLRKLLGVVNPRWNGFKMEDFNIQVEFRETTAIFCRTETKTEEYIGPNEFRGYSHTFKKHYT